MAARTSQAPPSASEFQLHPVPHDNLPPAPPNCETHTSGWEPYLSAKPRVMCKGHSKLKCAMQKDARRKGYFCWIERAYRATITHPTSSQPIHEFHAFCDTTHHWSEQVRISVFGKLHDHFRPNFLTPDVRPYLHLHPLRELPTRLSDQGGASSGDDREVAYLLNGDQVHVPSFNPFHAMADLQNFFIVQRMLSTQSIGGQRGAAWAASNMSIYPMAGCDGMGPSRGNGAIWAALASGRMHPPAEKLSKRNAAGISQHTPSFESLLSAHRVVPVAALLLSPGHGSAPLWTMGGSVAKCPHRSAVLHDFRHHVAKRLDLQLPPLARYIHRWERERSSQIKFFSRNAGMQAVPHATGKRRLVYVVRRSAGSSNISQSRKCHRCLWNVEALCDRVADMMPDAVVVLANPGELTFFEQYALFRTADVLIGVHGSAFGWGVFLTPTQAVLELPLPGSPMLNDWLFASLGVRTACVQACVIGQEPGEWGRGCSSEGGDADIKVILSTIRDLLLVLSRNQSQPVVWEKLGSRPNSLYSGYVDPGRPRRRAG